MQTKHPVPTVEQLDFPSRLPLYISTKPLQPKYKAPQTPQIRPCGWQLHVGGTHTNHQEYGNRLSEVKSLLYMAPHSAQLIWQGFVWGPDWVCACSAFPKCVFSDKAALKPYCIIKTQVWLLADSSTI